MTAVLNTKITDCAELAPHSDELHREIPAAVETRQEWEAALATSSDRLASAEGECEMTQVNLNDKIVEVEALSSQLSVAMERCALRDVALMKMADQLEASEQQRVRLEEMLAQKVTEITVVTRICEEMRIKVNTAHTTVATQKRALDLANSRLKAAEKARDAALERAAASHEAATKSANLNAELSAQFEAQGADLRYMRRGRDRARSEISEKMKEIATLITRRAELKSNLAAARNTNQALAARLETLEQAKADAQRNATDLRQELITIKNKILQETMRASKNDKIAQDVTALYAALKDENSSLITSLSDMQKKLTDLQEQLAAKVRELDEVQVQLAQRDLASKGGLSHQIASLSRIGR